MQIRRRPALVFSSAVFNGPSGFAFVAPITTKPQGHAFELRLPAGGRVKGFVLVHQVKSIDWISRKASAAGRVSPAIIAEAGEILKIILWG